MLRCTVHNRVTDQRYEFTAVDQAEIDARLERKSHVYGNPERREPAEYHDDHQIGYRLEQTSDGIVAIVSTIDPDNPTSVVERAVPLRDWKPDWFAGGRDPYLVDGTDGLQVVIPSERDVTITEVDPRPERIAAAWKAADAHASSGMDANSRASLLWLAVDPACPTWRRERIQAVQAWWAAVWSHYAAVKQQINAGVDATFDTSVPGPCPFTIWQIAGDAP